MESAEGMEAVMAKPPSKPVQPAMFPESSNGPQTVPVSEVVEAAKTGTPITVSDDAESEVGSWSSQPVAQAKTGNGATPAQSQEPPAQNQPSQAMSVQQSAPPMNSKKDPLPLKPTNVDELWRICQYLANNELVPKALRNKPGNVFAVCMKGRDFGWSEMQSIGALNIIDGKVEIGATAMVAQIRKSGLCKKWKVVETNARRAVIETLRAGDDEPFVYEYTVEEAEQAGLLGKDNWRKSLRDMLLRRCESKVGRIMYPDVVGAYYDHDEVSEMRDAERVIVTRVDGGAALASLSEADASMTAVKSDPPADPLKARLQQRASQSSGGLVRRCSTCKEILDPRDSDPCIACRPDGSE